MIIPDPWSRMIFTETPTGPIPSSSRDVCLSVCLSVCVCVSDDQSQRIFLGLTLTLRSHDQFKASHWSTLLRYHTPPQVFDWCTCRPTCRALKTRSCSGLHIWIVHAWEVLTRWLVHSTTDLSSPSYFQQKKWCFYPHRLRDLVSPICGIFYYELVLSRAMGAAKE